MPTVQLSWDQLADVAYAVGLRGDALATALAIAAAESNRYADAVGDVGIQTSKWGPSIGLWQVRSLKAERGTGKERDELALFSPAHNARSMYSISSGGTRWSPWSVYTKGLYRSHMDTARGFAQRRERAGGTGSVSGGGGAGLTGAWSTLTGAASGGGAPAAVDLGTSSDVLIPPASLPLNYSPPKQVSSIVIQGDSGARSNLTNRPPAEFVTGGNVELTSGEASELTLDFHNPRRALLGGGTILEAHGRFTWGQLELRIVGTELGYAPAGPSARITARSEGTYQLKRTDGFPDIAAKNLSPTEWLQRQVSARSGALRFMGKGSARRADIAPADTGGGKLETAWQVGQRLARELGYWLFEAGGVVYFGPPSWIVANTAELKVGAERLSWGDERLAAVELPDVRRSLDADVPYSLSFRLPRWRGELVRPGMRVALKGIGGVPATWIVTRVSYPIDGGIEPVTIDALEPKDPEPQPPGGAAADTPTGEAGVPGSGGPTGGGTPPLKQSGSASALDFVDLCLKQAGDRYVFGAETRSSDPDPDAWDCSELVEWACARVGIKIPDGAVNQWRHCKRITPAEGARTRGALLFDGDGTGAGRDAIYHVAISLGDGKTTIEARGRKYGTGSWPIGTRFRWAGLIPGMTYG